MKVLSLFLVLLGFSQAGFAFDCALVTVRSLPVGKQAKSVYCVVSGHGHYGDLNAPIIAISSLNWTLGSKEEACKEAFSACADPNAVFEYCAESTRCPISPYPQPFNCGVVPGK